MDLIHWTHWTLPVFCAATYGMGGLVWEIVKAKRPWRFRPQDPKRTDYLQFLLLLLVANAMLFALGAAISYNQVPACGLGLLAGICTGIAIASAARYVWRRSNDDPE